MFRVTTGTYVSTGEHSKITDDWLQTGRDKVRGIPEFLEETTAPGHGAKDHANCEVGQEIVHGPGSISWGVFSLGYIHRTRSAYSEFLATRNSRVVPPDDSPVHAHKHCRSYEGDHRAADVHRGEHCPSPC